MDRIRSTFPLDESAISRAALRQVLTDPITWVPLVPVVAAYTVFDVPGLVVAGCGGMVLLGVGAYWRKQWSGVTEGVRRLTIRQHNCAQDELLKQGAAELRRAGAKDYAGRLEQFLKIKTAVERRLHEDGLLTEQKMQLEQLVDSLCFGVRDQLTALAHQEKSREPVDREAALARIATAYDTLQSTVAELDTILGPTDAPAGLSHASLEEITRRLHEEAEIARRVQARLRQPEAPLQSE